MMRRNVVIACLICFFSVPLAMAASTNQKTNNAAGLTVEQIIQRNIGARGGLAAWHRIRSMTMTGKLDVGRERRDGGRVGMSPIELAKTKADLHKAVLKNDESPAGKIILLPFQMELKRPLKSRIEVQFQGDTAIQVFDGISGWKLRPFLGRRQVESYTQAEAKIASQQQELDGPLVDYVAKGTKVALEGMEQVNGSKAYKLKLTLKNGEVRHLWVDTKTFLDAKIDGAPRRFDGKLRSVLTYFHDYKMVDGVKIPYVLETSVEGISGSEKISIEHVVVNPNLNDLRFTKPI
jgi:hypothetical protein